jgi:hypothetical protein
MNNMRHKASRQFRNKRREYLKDEINDHETNSKNKNIRKLFRGINESERGYQPTRNLVNNENGDLVADSNEILNKWREHSSQLFNSHKINFVRQIQIHAVSLLLTQPSFRGIKFLLQS